MERNETERWHMRARILILSTLLAWSTILVAQGLDKAKIDEAMGRPGQQNGDVYRLGFPRTDVHVSIAGVEIKAGLALGAWASFRASDSNGQGLRDRSVWG